MKSLERVNETIEHESEALWKSLSSLGRRAFYPPDIPFQAAQARSKTYNGTIGQITDGAGNAVPLPSLAAGLAGLSDAERNKALLYSPVEGIPQLRQAWRRWQQGKLDDPPPTTLPQVTSGITNSLALLADLFAEEGRTVVVPYPYWDNYRKTFELRRGARLVEAPAYEGDGYRVGSVGEALADLPAGEPALVILNFPSNPGGYSLTRSERQKVREHLIEVAEKRPLVVITDDAYAGLVYEDDVPRESFFWNLVGAHPNLVPVKADGVTKELSFFGGRVGFITFGFADDSEIAAALSNKITCLARATIGSPVATSQMLALHALESDSFAAEVNGIRSLLAGRYRVLKDALSKVDPDLLTPLPFNSGCFATARLPEGVDAEEVRVHLLDNYDTGLVSVDPLHVRIAHCSATAEALPEMVKRLEQGVGDLVGRRAARV